MNEIFIQSNRQQYKVIGFNLTNFDHPVFIPRSDQCHYLFPLTQLEDNKNRRSTNVALTSIKNIKVLFYSEMIKLNYSKFILLNEILVLID